MQGVVLIFSKLKFESGVHRVQRVPTTETQGRVHTSAASVAVLYQIEVEDILVNLIIFDVAGQKRFQTLRDVFFRKANGALLVFDLTRPETLDDLYEWKKQIDDRLGRDGIPNILVGNKSDLEESIKIDYGFLEDQVIPDFLPIKYLETSAYQDENIREIFSLLTEEILKNQGIIN